MKNIKKLNKKIKSIKSQLNLLEPTEDTTLFEFIKYKQLLKKFEETNIKISEVYLLAETINNTYNSNIKKWVSNPKIHFKIYHIMQLYALYNRNLKLYNLGFFNKKPLSPLTQKILQYFPKFNFEKYNLEKFNIIKIISKKYDSFRNKILPRALNKIALEATKTAIKGYRTLQQDYRYFRSYIDSQNSVKYIRNVINEANKEIGNADAYARKPRRSSLLSGKTFRESLIVPDNAIVFTYNGTNNRGSVERISQPTVR